MAYRFILPSSSVVYTDTSLHPSQTSYSRVKAATLITEEGALGLASLWVT